MANISSGIPSLDSLIDSLHIGDNVVWEVDSGTAYDIFVKNFVRQSNSESQKVIYVSFNRSPQSIINEIAPYLTPEYFILIDCFTSGKGKNDPTFLKYYERERNVRTIRVNDPKNIEEFTRILTSIEDDVPAGTRYVLDSLTGMQDLWGDENSTYKFFTYMCPRLFDLDTVAYWILDKDAHSQNFKANLRHITQVVIDLYKRKEKLFIKALKLSGRQDREAFKPHLYEITQDMATITSQKREPATDIGGRLREMRTRRGMSQKELAVKVGLTPSFISQLENNQISPSLSSFLQLCAAVAVKPGDFLEGSREETAPWLFPRDKVLSKPPALEDGVRVFPILNSGTLSVSLAVIPPGADLGRHFLYHTSPQFLYVVKGAAEVTLEAKTEYLSQGDGLFVRDTFPARWKNDGEEETEILVMWERTAGLV